MRHALIRSVLSLLQRQRAVLQRPKRRAAGKESRIASPGSIKLGFKDDFSLGRPAVAEVGSVRVRKGTVVAEETTLQGDLRSPLIATGLIRWFRHISACLLPKW